MLPLVASIVGTRPLFESFWTREDLLSYDFRFSIDDFRTCEASVGARGPIVFELNTAVRESRISWGKALADLTELAKLRWERKWTVAGIAEHQGVSFHSAKMRLRRLRKKNGCYDRLSSAAKRCIPKK
jgi:hypothetical protein